jgi:AcrR family transcriptional regulator
MKHKPRCVSKAPDPRSERTRGLITRAFFDLLGRRGYDRIRVSDITRKAHVGRATFYAHFASKDALLKSELNRVVVPMLVARHGDRCHIDCTMLFAHIQHSRDLYRSVMAGSTRVITERLVQDVLEARIGAILAARGEATPPAEEFVPRFVASTILTLLAWSLEQSVSRAPSELQDTFQLLTASAMSEATSRRNTSELPEGSR